MRISILLIALLSVSNALAQESRYQRCSTLVNSAPEEALKLAETDIQRAPSPSAFHCRAMALFALKRYEQAAGALETLAEQLVNKNPLLWGNVVKQTARSWELAGDSARAIVVLTQAITQMSESPETAQSRLLAELLLERSQLYLSGKRELFALQDLDQAISLAPNYAPLLMKRAELFALQGENELARRDMQSLSAISPTYPGLSALQKKLAQ